jgi:hypothetical protein
MTAVEVRQGWTGMPVLYVLIGGLILAAIVVIGLQFWSVSEDLPAAGLIEPDTPAAANLPVPGQPSPVIPPVTNPVPPNQAAAPGQPAQ